MDILLTIANILGMGAALYIMKMGIDYNKGLENVEPIDFSNLSPAEVNYLLKDVNYMNRAIVSTLLDLYRRNIINIKPYSREARKKGEADVLEYEFTLLSRENLSTHEAIFIQNIFEYDEIVTTDNLTQLALNEKEFLKKQAKWVNEIENTLKEKGFYGNNNKSQTAKVRVLSVLIFALGILSLIKSQYIGLLTIMIAMGSLLVGVNMGMDKSGFGRSVHSHYENLENMAVNNNITNKLSDVELIELISMGLTMKYFLPIYENNKSAILSVFSDYLNDDGGSKMDDAILRGFMGFIRPTREDSIDTNRVDLRLFK